MDSDYFHPHIMLRFLKDDFQTYLKAVKYFYNIDLSSGDLFGRTSENKKNISNSQVLNPEEEYLLLNCLLADQHELCHHFQYISTSFGINHWILNAFYWDYMRELAGKLYLFFSQNKNNLPLLELAEKFNNNNKGKIEYLDLLLKARRGLNSFRKIFDNTTKTIYEAVQEWNFVCDYLESSILVEEDNVLHCRFMIPNQKSELANPPGITLLSLLECSARCNDLLILSKLNVKEKVKEKILREISKDELYTSIFVQIVGIIDPSFAIPVLIRLIGIALQSPVSNLHIDLNARKEFHWKDFSPTWRFKKLVDLLNERKITPSEIINDINFPDEICSKLGWPKISEQKKYFISNKQYLGQDKLVPFVMDQHKRFCKVSIEDLYKPIWIQDALINQKYLSNAYIEKYANSFFPPFHLVGDKIITHNTCKDYEEMLGIYLVLLTSTVAKEILLKNNINETEELLSIYKNWGKDHNEAFLSLFEDEIWPSAFFSMFGFQYTHLVKKHQLNRWKINLRNRLKNILHLAKMNY